MRDDSDLESRVAALEREVAALKATQPHPPTGPNWLADLMARDDRDEEGMTMLAEIVRANREAGVFDEASTSP